MNIYDEIYEGELGIEEDDKERMELVGLVQRADFVNKNRRFYPKEVLGAAVDKFKLKLKQSFSQIDHPDIKAKLKDTSHLIRDLYWDDDNLMAKITVLDTEPGRTLREIVRAGGRPGLSTRGKGQSAKVKVDGQEIEKISPGFEITGIDFVTSPAVLGAEVKQILRESEEDQTLIRIKQRVQKLAGMPITECKECTYNDAEVFEDCFCPKCGHTQERVKPCTETKCTECGTMMQDPPKAKQPSMKPKEQEYDCQCFKCGNKQTSDKPCRDTECEKCGGAMKSTEGHESLHRKAQSLAGLDMKFFKEDRDKDPVIKQMHRKLQALAGLEK